MGGIVLEIGEADDEGRSVNDEGVAFARFQLSAPGDLYVFQLLRQGCLHFLSQARIHILGMFEYQVGENLGLHLVHASGGEPGRQVGVVGCRLSRFYLFRLSLSKRRLELRFVEVQHQFPAEVFDFSKDPESFLWSGFDYGWVGSVEKRSGGEDLLSLQGEVDAEVMAFKAPPPLFFLSRGAKDTQVVVFRVAAESPVRSLDCLEDAFERAYVVYGPGSGLPQRGDQEFLD